MKVKFFNQKDFVHLTADPESLTREGYSFKHKGTRGGTLYAGGVSVTLPDYLESWSQIARLGGSTPVAVKLPAGKLLVDFYATFGSKDVNDVEEVKTWAEAQNKWKVTKRTQVASYDEEGFSGWVDDEPDEESETREYSGFLVTDMDAIFNAYVEARIPRACGVWYWDEDEPSSFSAPHGIVLEKFATKVAFSTFNDVLESAMNVEQLHATAQQIVDALLESTPAEEKVAGRLMEEYGMDRLDIEAMVSGLKESEETDDLYPQWDEDSRKKMNKILQDIGARPKPAPKPKPRRRRIQRDTDAQQWWLS